MDVETDEAVETFFEYNGFEVSELEVASGETEQLALEAQVSEETPTGQQDMNITASGNAEASEQFSFDVRGQQLEEPSFNMDVSDTFIRLNPGEEKNIPVNFRNTGQISVENIELDADSDELEIDVPETDISIEEFRNEEVVVQVSAPENAEPGDYFVDFQASTDGADDQTDEIRANITEQSALRYVGLLIMLGSLGALIMVYRRFGRR